jgi:hypothetical protein
MSGNLIAFRMQKRNIFYKRFFHGSTLYGVQKSRLKVFRFFFVFVMLFEFPRISHCSGDSWFLLWHFESPLLPRAANLNPRCSLQRRIVQIVNHPYCSGQKTTDSSWGHPSEALGNLGSGNLDGEGLGEGWVKGGQFTSNLWPRWTDPVTARRVPSM